MANSAKKMGLDERIDEMPSSIIIRQPPKDYEPETDIIDGDWSNLTLLSSLTVSQDLIDRYRDERFSIWERPLDRVVIFRQGKGFASPASFQLFRYLNRVIDRKNW